MRDELCESLTLLPCRSDARIWITKPGESRMKEFVGRRSVPTGSLSVERPPKHKLRGPILFRSHSSKPMVNERRLPDTGPGNNGNDIYFLICPCVIQEG